MLERKKLTKVTIDFINKVANGAYKANTIEILVYLAEYYIKFDQILPQLDTLIHRLVETKQTEGFEYLLKLGTDMDLRTSKKYEKFPYCTMLHIAVSVNAFDIARALLENGARVNATDIYENTPLHYGAMHGEIKMIELLLQFGAALDVMNKHRVQPIHSVILSNNLECYELLLNHMNPLNLPGGVIAILEKRTMKNFTSLLLALHKGCLDIFRLLLSKGTDVNAQDDRGRSTLHIAIDQHQVEMVPLILQHKPKINISDSFGNTAIMYAIQKGFIDIAKMLEKYGASLSGVNQKGDTLLHMAAKLDRVDMVAWLIDNGVNPFVKNSLN